jgi:hypothetical protein
VCGPWHCRGVMHTAHREHASPLIQPSDVSSLQNEGAVDSQGRSINMYSAVCLLRGRVYDAMENRSRAIHWYK